jgi:hypothetical protein
MQGPYRSVREMSMSKVPCKRFARSCFSMEDSRPSIASDGRSSTIARSREDVEW